MKIRKAVITAAGANQRNLPMQNLLDQDGKEQSVLGLIVSQACRAGIEDIGIVVWPGDEQRYAPLLRGSSARITFLPQSEPLGYAHAMLCARDFTAGEAFLHCVGDHVYVDPVGHSCAEELVSVAEKEDCAVSGVQITREGNIGSFGTIGGEKVSGGPHLYRVETVSEKPTPTLAEQRLIVPGLRSGNYLCFFGMHVLTPSIFPLIEEMPASAGRSISWALDRLAKQEQYLALVQSGRRFDVGSRYGLFTSQLAIALSGRDRDAVLTQFLELIASPDFAPSRETRA